nr:hypothetical protein [Tanacetum cinerariifolium]
MKMQPEVGLRKLAAFMGKLFTVQEEERWVVAEIRTNIFNNREIGGWQNYLSQDMKENIKGPFTAKIVQEEKKKTVASAFGEDQGASPAPRAIGLFSLIASVGARMKSTFIIPPFLLE